MALSRFVLPYADVGAGIRPSSGAKLFFYATGTSTFKSTFTDATGSTANTNPVIANANGVFPAIFLDGIFNVALKDASDVQIWTEDPYQSSVSSSFVFSTVAAMTTATPLAIDGSTVVFTSGMFVSIVDYATGNNSGVMFGSIVAGGTGTADGGSYIDLANGTQWKQNFPTSLISPKFFGAVLDGTTGDTLPLQATIDYVATIFGVVDLGGQSAKLDKHLNLKGEYILKNGKILIPADIDLTGAPTFGGSIRSIYSQSNSNLTIESVDFIGTKIGLTKRTSIATVSCNNLIIKSCSFKDFGDDNYYVQGLIVFGGAGVNIEDCSFNNCSGDGGAVAEGASQIKFSNNTCQDNHDWGFAFSNNCTTGVVADNLFLNNTSTGTGADECIDFTFTGNVSLGNEHGIRITRFGTTTTDQRDIVINGNECRGNQYGIDVGDCDGPSAIVITGNSVRGSSAQGIRVSDSEGFVVCGNYVQGSTSEAILIVSYTDPVGKAVISGNMIDSCTYGVRQLNAGGSLSDISVISNHVINASVARYAGIQGWSILSQTNDFRFSKAIGVTAALTSTSATVGGISSPGNFSGFMDIYVDGTKKKVPYFNA
jgi:hypothetical protein